MKPKIKIYEEFRISIVKGLSKLYISKNTDNTFHISISKYDKEKTFIEIPYTNSKSIFCLPWKKI